MYSYVEILSATEDQRKNAIGLKILPFTVDSFTPKDSANGEGNSAPVILDRSFRITFDADGRVSAWNLVPRLISAVGSCCRSGSRDSHRPSRTPAQPSRKQQICRISCSKSLTRGSGSPPLLWTGQPGKSSSPSRTSPRTPMPTTTGSRTTRSYRIMRCCTPSILPCSNVGA